MTRFAVPLECINFPVPSVMYPASLNARGMTCISGCCWNSFLLLFDQTPVFHGIVPLKTIARDGLHAGDAQCALVNRTPRFASRSMFGVWAGGPKTADQSLRSSTATNRTFGHSGTFARACTARAENKQNRTLQYFRHLVIDVLADVNEKDLVEPGKLPEQITTFLLFFNVLPLVKQGLFWLDMSPDHLSNKHNAVRTCAATLFSVFSDLPFRDLLVIFCPSRFVPQQMT